MARTTLPTMSDDTKAPALDLKASPPKPTEPTLMPQAPDVEKSLLSMMCIDPVNVISQAIGDGLSNDYFYIPSHRILWEIFAARHEKNQPVDVTSVAPDPADGNLNEAVRGHAGAREVFSYATTTALFEAPF